MLQPLARKFTCRLAARKPRATAIAKPARRCSTFFPSGSRFTLITVASCSARRLMKWKSKGQRPEQGRPGQTMKRFLAMLMSAGAQATGVKLRAVLNNEIGNAEIYSLQLGPRLVLLSLIGSDKEIAATAPAWLAIRRSLKIEASTNLAALARESTAAGHLIGSR